MEARAQRSLPAEQQLGILRALLRTDMFERFLAERFPHSKARSLQSARQHGTRHIALC